MTRRLLLTFGAVLIWFSAAPAFAEEALPEAALPDAKAPALHLRIGTLHSPPFIIRNTDGSWSGISVELWEAIATDLGLTFEFEEYTIGGMLDGVRNGDLDVAAAALTITEDREMDLDFTHPFHTTGFAIATQPGHQTNVWFAVFQQLFSWDFVQVAGLLAMVLLVVGWVIWLVEHKHQPGHEEDSHTIRHISEGFWWAAATMTTVGYGDKTPLTRAGRALGVVWMFTALMLVASFIAAFSSVLTVSKLGGAMHGPEDLARARVATVPASTSEGYLQRRGIVALTYPTAEEAMRAVVEGRVDAMVYDAPLLRYLARTRFPGHIEILPMIFERQDYGFALPAGSELREPINRSLLAVIRHPDWSRTLAVYLGD